MLSLADSASFLWRWQLCGRGRRLTGTDRGRGARAPPLPPLRSCFADLHAGIAEAATGDSAGLRTRIDELRRLWSELARPDADAARVTQLFDEAAQQRYGYRRELTLTTLSFLSNLSPEQRERFVALARQRPWDKNASSTPPPEGNPPAVAHCAPNRTPDIPGDRKSCWGPSNDMPKSARAAHGDHALRASGNRRGFFGDAGMPAAGSRAAPHCRANLGIIRLAFRSDGGSEAGGPACRGRT